MEIFYLLAGVLFFYTHHFSLLFFAVLLCVLWRRILWIFLFAAAVIYAFVHQQIVLPKNENLAGLAAISGQIASIPAISPYKSQFNFQIDSFNGKKIHSLVLLSWYNKAPPLALGQQWQFLVKLKAPRNLNNPGAFNFAQWLSIRHIAWTGYVKNGTVIAKPKNFFPLLALREHLGMLWARSCDDPKAAGVLQALTLGLTQAMDKSLWDLFRHTGTTHLMVISGAHIGLVAGLVFGFIKRLWQLSAYGCLRYPSLKIAGWMSFLAALTYALLAGFAVPAQRSLVGCAFLAFRNLGSKKYSPWQIWRYALLLVMLFEPHAVLMPGFYLSFLAVAFLMITSQRWSYIIGFKKMLLLQAGCLIGLMPLCLFWFSYASVNGFIANLIAIPMVGFAIVPLGLITLLFLNTAWAWLFLKPLTFLVQSLLKYLQWVDSLSALNFSYTFGDFFIVLALLSALLIAVILPLRSTYTAAFTLCLGAFFPYFLKINSGEAIVYVLDVGQGLAVVVQTEKHVLIYDTGDKFYQGSDMGKLAILPFLQSRGVKTVDKIVISHPDKDHKGGLESLEKGISSKELIVDEVKFYHRGVSCHDYAPWQWEGVDFKFFPIKKRFKGKNNHSCILQINQNGKKLLLTGDIEKNAEEYLVERYGKKLQSDILLVPHHGSKTSSSEIFLLTVMPKYAIASLGFDNRFHFPHENTVLRYKALEIPFYMTKDCGMVTINFSKGEKDIRPVCFAAGKLNF